MKKRHFLKGILFLLIIVLFTANALPQTGYASVTITTAATSNGSWNMAAAPGAGPYIFTPNAGSYSANVSVSDIQARMGYSNTTTAEESANDVTIETACSGGTGPGNITVGTNGTPTNLRHYIDDIANGGLSLQPAYTLTLDAGGYISFNDLLYLNARYTSPGNGRAGHSLYMVAGDYIRFRYDMNASASAGSVGADGGDVTAIAGTYIQVSRSILSAGSEGTGGDGGDGGDVYLHATTGIIITDDINVNGGKARQNWQTNGSGGDIYIYNEATTVTSGGTNDGQTSGSIYSSPGSRGTGGVGGSLTKEGPGTLMLSRRNQYEGATWVNEGTLRASGVNAVRASNDGPFGNNASELYLNGGTIESGVSQFSRPITVSATNSGLDAYGSARTISSTIDNETAASTFNLNIGANTVASDVGQELTLSDVISNSAGSLSITKVGTSTLILTAANTYSGGCNLDAGVLELNNATALGTGTYTINGGTFDNTSGADLVLTSNNAQIWNTDPVYTGTASLDMGTGTVSFSADRQVTVSANTLTIGGIINQPTHSLTKAGAGILNFTDQAVSLNNFTNAAGTLTSTSGTLSLAGDFSNSATFVHNSGLVEFTTGTPSAIGTTTFFDVLVPTSVSLSVPSGSAATIEGTMTDIGTVTIPGGGALTIQPAAFLLIDPTGYLNSAGTLTNNSDSAAIVIQSDATSTGTLILNNAGVQANVQRYMTKGIWHLVTVPVSGQAISSYVSDPANSIGYNSTTTDYAMMPYDPVNNRWSPTYFRASTAGDLEAGHGYMIRRKSSGTDGVVSGYGELQYGDITVTGLYAKVWNCIGNPYTSAIGVTAGSATTANFLTVNGPNLDPGYGGIYIWVEQPGYTGPTRSDYEVITNSGYGSTLAKDYLQSGQGFFVKTGDVTSLEFTTLMQENKGDEAYLKSSSLPWFGFDLVASTSSYTINTAVAFNETMTAGLDRTYDAGVLKGNPQLSVYTKLVEDNGLDIALQCLPIEGMDTVIIPVGLDFPEGGDLTFTAKTDRVVPGTMVILEDQLLGTMVRLDSVTEGYTVTLPAGTSGTGRFYLRTAYPVEENNETNEEEENETLSIYGSSLDQLIVYSSGKKIYLKGELPENSRLTLYSIDGRLLKQYVSMGGEYQEFDAAEFREGIYLLNMNDKGDSKTYRILLGSNW